MSSSVTKIENGSLWIAKIQAGGWPFMIVKAEQFIHKNSNKSHVKILKTIDRDGLHEFFNASWELNTFLVSFERIDS